MPEINYEKFKDLTYRDFRTLARDDSLSKYEKIGFPDSYRKGFDNKIFADIQKKLTHLNKKNKLIMDIGPGCSELAVMLIELCKKNNHQLILIDSKEMLDNLPDESFIEKIPCYYPSECHWVFETYKNKIDSILTYSVLHYIFAESSIFRFIDVSLGLLADSGQMLVGDIPNISKRKRFFSSPTGIRFHQNFTNTKTIPEVTFNTLEPDTMDDAVLFSLVMRCRNSGFDAYLLPQSENLPMANRREDILIIKP